MAFALLLILEKWKRWATIPYPNFKDFRYPNIFSNHIRNCRLLLKKTTIDLSNCYDLTGILDQSCQCRTAKRTSRPHRSRSLLPFVLWERVRRFRSLLDARDPACSARFHVPSDDFHGSTWCQEFSIHRTTLCWRHWKLSNHAESIDIFSVIENSI